MRDNTLVLKDECLGSDAAFSELYPYSIRLTARRHWTPIHIVKQVIGFLGMPGTSVLDIGSGAGKFCLLAAHHAPDVQLVGVEQRSYLIRNALRVQKVLDIPNVSFINTNFTELNLQEFDHFYFYNSFYENIANEDMIDHHIAYSEGLYDYYVHFLRKELQCLPRGTRIATYHSGDEEIPPGYRLVESHFDTDLKFWIRR